MKTLKLDTNRLVQGDYDDVKDDWKVKITAKQVLAYIKKEKKRMYNRLSNIVFFAESRREVRVKINFKTFKEIMSDFQHNSSDDFMHPPYDDESQGAHITVISFDDRSKKTQIAIEI